MYCRGNRLGPGDRVLAGLSVSFDASCEEMWLAWRNGACLVPAPRSVVRSGADLGPWLVQRHITAISTVPTLAALWPSDTLDGIRLLILGGEACPAALMNRLAGSRREVWNTYGPTEATVISCGAMLDGTEPNRIGLPLPGWDLAVVDPEGNPVRWGEEGELVIGGVGLGRYLDPTEDAAKYAPMAGLSWSRAYRSGDVVLADPQGLVFRGRADDQVKLAGRRVELGEIDAALTRLPNVAAAASAVRTTSSGNRVLAGYLVQAPGKDIDLMAARSRLMELLPAQLVPTLGVVQSLPIKASGKVDRKALPWPLPGGMPTDSAPELTGTSAWLAAQWAKVLGPTPLTMDSDFFALGGGSVAAAQLVSLVRTRHPKASIADIYTIPGLGPMADYLDSLDDPTWDERRNQFNTGMDWPASAAADPGPVLHQWPEVPHRPCGRRIVAPDGRCYMGAQSPATADASGMVRAVQHPVPFDHSRGVRPPPDAWNWPGQLPPRRPCSCTAVGHGAHCRLLRARIPDGVAHRVLVRAGLGVPDRQGCVPRCHAASDRDGGYRTECVH